LVKEFFEHITADKLCELVNKENAHVFIAIILCACKRHTLYELFKHDEAILYPIFHMPIGELKKLMKVVHSPLVVHRDTLAVLNIDDALSYHPDYEDNALLIRQLRIEFLTDSAEYHRGRKNVRVLSLLEKRLAEVLGNLPKEQPLRLRLRLTLHGAGELRNEEVFVDSKSEDEDSGSDEMDCRF